MINVIILSIILVLLVLYGFHEFLDIDDQCPHGIMIVKSLYQLFSLRSF